MKGMLWVVKMKLTNGRDVDKKRKLNLMNLKKCFHRVHFSGRYSYMFDVSHFRTQPVEFKCASSSKN